jgi:hypothetical protein
MIPIGSSGSFMTQTPDAEGKYHVFHPSGDDSYTQISIKLDAKILKKMGPSLEPVIALVNQALDSGDLEEEIKIEYLPATTMQSEGIRIQTVSAGVWTQAVETGKKERYWSPIERFIQEDQYAEFTSSAASKGLYEVEVNPKRLNPESILRSVHYNHEVEGDCYGAESAYQSGMISQYIEGAQGLCDSLNFRILDYERRINSTHALTAEASATDQACMQQKIKTWQEQIELAKFQLDFHTKKLIAARDYFARTGSEMVDSNYFRDLLKEVTADYIQISGKSKKTLGQEDFDLIYTQTCDRYIPALCNCWQQEARGMYKDPVTGQTLSDTHMWMRMGAFYDVRSGLFTALDFFESSTGALKSDTELEALGTSLLARLAQEEARLQKELPENKNVFSRLFARSAPSVMGCLSAVHWLQRNIPPDPAQPKKINLRALKQLLMERKAIQESAFVTLLEKQVAGLKEGQDKLEWLHVSLLKPFEGWKKSDQIDAPGWTHHEKHEIAEMQWVFRHFRGAQIQFADFETPTNMEYDAAGKPEKIIIGSQHAPKHMVGKTIDLESHFVSCSVADGIKAAGHRNGEGRSFQGEINRDFYKYAQDSNYLPAPTANTAAAASTGAQPVDALEALEYGYSSYAAAEDLAHEMLSRGWAISGGCQSGKDRTGFWASRLAQKKILSTYDTHAPKSASPQTRQLLDENPLRGRRVTTQILEANTGKTAIKVGVFSLPGYDRFLQRRLSHYGCLAYEQFLQKKAAKVQVAVEKKFTI